MNYKKENLLFLPLGGSGEIGMNCNLYHYQGKWIMIDLGVTFSDNESSSYDIILPDIDFIIEKVKNLSAIILTHAHEDHIGAVPYLLNKLGNIPIYTTSFTASVLRRKFESMGINDFRIFPLEYDKTFSIGPFDIEIFCLTHSIPEPNAVLIKTNKGNIFHTGDWKIDPEPLIGKPIDSRKLKNVVKDGVDVMVCDSTNIFESNHSGSENDVRRNLKQIFSNKKNGKIIITCFASNVARIETILKVSNESDKYCLMLGRSLKKIYESANENNYLKGFGNIVSEKEAKIIPDENLVIICTGSQGESRAALSRVVKGQHRFLELQPNDLIIFSSREIPGNEKKINEIKSEVIKCGCTLLDDSNSDVHVSGHPSKVELKEMYNWISPELLIPIHGEYRHLHEHVKFAKQCGIKNQILAENGDLVKLDKDEKKQIVDKIQSGRLVLRGNQVISINDKLLKDLDNIINDGQIFINLIMNLDNELLSEPIIFCPSLLIDNSNKVELVDLISNNVIKLSKKSIDDNILSNELKIMVKSFLKMKTGLKSSTFIEIVRI